MPQVETHKIQILLNMSLAKANAELNRNGFDKLIDDISKTLKNDKLVISKRYIDERIYQQLKKAKENDLSVSLKYEYLDEMSRYLGLDNFFDFERKYEKITSYFKNHQPNEVFNQSLISIIYDKREADFVERKCKQSLYANQPNTLQYIPTNYNEIERDKLIDYFNNSSVSLIFLNPDLISCHFDLLKFIDEESKEQKNIIPIWPDSEFEEKQEFEPTILSFKWLANDDFGLLLQYILSENISSSNKEISKESQEKPTITNIKDSGTVNLGKIKNIKAEYISSRDMHININKSESDD